jgi:hypothetical protein
MYSREDSATQMLYSMWNAVRPACAIQMPPQCEASEAPCARQTLLSGWLAQCFFNLCGALRTSLAISSCPATACVPFTELSPGGSAVRLSHPGEVRSHPGETQAISPSSHQRGR